MTVPIPIPIPFFLRLRYVQLNDSIVQGRTHPRSDGVKGQALDPRRLGFKLGQHGAVDSCMQRLLQSNTTKALVLVVSGSRAAVGSFWVSRTREGCRRFTNRKLIRIFPYSRVCWSNESNSGCSKALNPVVHTILRPSKLKDPRNPET
jgi:hypothetical protein